MPNSLSGSRLSASSRRSSGDTVAAISRTALRTSDGYALESLQNVAVAATMFIEPNGDTVNWCNVQRLYVESDTSSAGNGVQKAIRHLRGYARANRMTSVTPNTTIRNIPAGRRRIAEAINVEVVANAIGLRP